MWPRVLTIFVRFGQDEYAEAECRLGERFARQLPSVKRDVVVVDNLQPPGLIERRPGRTVIGGDNTAWEFSAVDTALAYVGAAIWNYDLVNIVTSAFERLYVAYLDCFTPSVLAATIGARACVGHIDCYNDEVGVLSYRSQHWLRTSFIVLPPLELMLLGSVVSTRHRRPWFNGHEDGYFAADAPLSDNYRKYMLDWLLGEDIGQGVRWHKSLSLEGDGLRRFEQKVLAILNEHLLGIRLRAAGCRTIDVTWLSSVLASGQQPEWDTPWWEQLAGCGRDVVRIERWLALDTPAP